MSDNTETNKHNYLSINGNIDEKYKQALALKFYEGQISWQMNILFVALNVGIGTIIQSKIYELPGWSSLLFIMSIVGITINIFWLGTFRRNNKYYHLRMAQARQAEPKGWDLLEGRGYRFSKGERIEIPRESLLSKENFHELTQFEQLASNKRAIAVVIWIIIGLYVLSLLLTILPYLAKLVCYCL